MEQTISSEKCIYVAFRFHVNFYHSYRGDSPDEKGIGKDIRIIRHILDALERLSESGVCVHGTWDIENHFSLERIMPQFCPDIIERIRSRVSGELDEIEPMSYNNGIVSAHNLEEFEYVLDRTVSNDRGSGIRDVFVRWEPILRPQECMYTPSFLRLYPRHGIHAISLYYSCHPFNGFSNFIKPLPFAQRYNPLWLEAPGSEGRMTLLPCCNIGDVVDHISLKRWVRGMRREQLRMAEPADLLLLLDMDADDDFWTGYGIPLLTGLYTTASGLESVARSVSGLPFVRFAKPGDYLRSHAPMGTVSIGQDTADGSFDGYSSWTEKWQNKTLWTGIERSRLHAAQALTLLGGADGGGPEEECLKPAMHKRVLAMSTTHFGLASPVMNAERLRQAEALAEESAAAALEGLRRAMLLREAPRGRVRLLFCNPVEEAANRGTPQTGPGPGRCMARMKLPEDFSDAGNPVFVDDAGNSHAVFVRNVFGSPEMCFLLETDKRETVLSWTRDGASIAQPCSVDAVDGRMGNGILTLRMEDGCPALYHRNERVTAPGFPRGAVRYGGRLAQAVPVNNGAPRLLAGGAAAVWETHGEATLSRGGSARLAWNCQYTLLSGLPYLYADVEMKLPKTEDFAFDRRRAERLGRGWDARWNEIMPWEVALAFVSTRERPFTVWKRNYFGDVSSYALDYGISGNSTLASLNNQITAEWVAVGNGERGLLLSQCASSNMSAAFCPMRLQESRGVSRLTLNPFGTYHGRQWNYPTRRTGLGRAMALRMADHLSSYAPSYNGETVRFSLMVAPFEGERPPEQVCRDACLHAYPPLVTAEGLPFSSVVSD